MRNFLICVIVAVMMTSVIQADYTENNIEKNDLQDVNFNSCKCANNNCGCCEHVKVDLIHVNAIVCSNITYLPNDYGISITITYNSHTVFNDTVSARNPPPFCIGQPFVDYLKAEVCVRLYDLDFNKHHLSGCVRLEAVLRNVVIAKYEMGCFNIPDRNTKNVDVSNMFKTFLGKLGFLNQTPVVNMV